MSNLPHQTSSVLFVCTANRCRSMIAAALWAQRLTRIAEVRAAWAVSSAGTWAEDGAPPPGELCRLLLERGIEISAERSRRLTRDLLAGHNLILVMEPGHKEALGVEFPDFKDRVFMLSEPAGRSSAVPDPDGGDAEAFIACIEEIDALLTLGEKRIVELARRPRKTAALPDGGCLEK